MYEYRGIAVIDGDLTQLNELAAEGWRVVTHLPGHDSLDQYLLERREQDGGKCVLDAGHRYQVECHRADKGPCPEFQRRLELTQTTIDRLSCDVSASVRWTEAVQTAAQQCRGAWPFVKRGDTAPHAALLDLIARGPAPSKYPYIETDTEGGQKGVS